MSRKDERADITPYRLHTKSFEKTTLKEEVLADGSVKIFVEGFASTIDKDYDGDVILPEGIDTARYEQNPIIKRGHKRGEENNIGRCTSLKVVAGEGVYITAEVILNPVIEDHAKILHGIRHRLINGFSIGFGGAKRKYDEARKVNVINYLELHEISLVDIPNNPMTVTKMLAKIAEDEKNLETTIISPETHVVVVPASEIQPPADISLQYEEGEDMKDLGEEEVVVSEEEVMPEVESEEVVAKEVEEDASEDEEKMLATNKLKVGKHYRVQKTYVYEWDDETYSYTEVYNGELIKIDAETNGTAEDPYLIFLCMKLTMQGYKPTTYTLGYQYSQIDDMMLLSEEQMKALNALKNADLKDIEEPKEDPVDETIAAEEAEISVGNDISKQLAEDIQSKALEIEQKDAIIAEKDALIAEKDAEIVELKSIKEAQDVQADEAVQVINGLSEALDKAKAVIESSSNTFKKIGVITSIDGTKKSDAPTIVEQRVRLADA